MTVLVLGASGMLGHAVFRYFRDAQVAIRGTVRSSSVLRHFPDRDHSLIHVGVDAERQDDLMRIFDRVRPDVVINCVGVVKQRADACDPLRVVPIIVSQSDADP